jgi:hypothetical protein
MREVEVARLERGEEADVADLGLRLAEAKQLTAALQAEMVSTQVTVVGECCRWCGTCGCVLTSKGYYAATFRSLFGDVSVGSGVCLPVLARFGKGQEFRRRARPSRGNRGA